MSKWNYYVKDVMGISSIPFILIIELTGLKIAISPPLIVST